ncbi:hypothetical protein GGTG_00520 [Gaeumannomyces tritici R3-111a-1]|uniref:Uncharacterized protein n=1 Tax=Gaeumannomyces tritici (strain R3-111a-1) TaxID=644352 RepID=J3NGY4_GAET3|nr:hypothetical protein GGTG_00520 [Gaeumannomyces tritici R3-111a-1]EJT80524.1 hypothetical protein GGTG_00520 [Gaeumannomyces tritici R3-111a-1]
MIQLPAKAGPDLSQDAVLHLETATDWPPLAHLCAASSQHCHGLPLIRDSLDMGVMGSPARNGILASQPTSRPTSRPCQYQCQCGAVVELGGTNTAKQASNL